MQATKPLLSKPRLDEDIVPFTECRRRLAEYFEKTRRTHRPIIVTQNGRATSAIITVSDLEQIQDFLELMDDVKTAEAELDAGLGIPQDKLIADFETEDEAMRKELGL